MGKIAFIFPGQGAQYQNMAREFYENFPESRFVFERASKAAGFSLEELCFMEGEKLNQTRYTQPALLTACCAILQAVKQTGILPDMTAGLSLGEYCALLAARVMDLDQAVKVVCCRGAYMEEEVPAGKGAMRAVLSRRELPFEEICRETEGIVTVANYNCPGQRVLSGEAEAVERAAEKLMEAGASRTVALNVSGPFHSPMLRHAGSRLYQILKSTECRRPNISFISNVTAKEEKDPQQIRELLGRQVYSPVLWEQSVRRMAQLGADIFIEIGPGKTLSRLIWKTLPGVKTYSVERPEDLEKLADELRRSERKAG